MSDAPALLEAIRAAPDDDAPRLVYADWLDERGQPDRAEFIRVQCKLARRNSAALRRREVELLAEHHDALAGPLAAPHLRFRFHRGFIVGFGHTGVFLGVQRLFGWYYMLRFFPHGPVMSVLSANLANIASFFEDSYPYISKIEYQLDLPADQTSTRLAFRLRPWVTDGFLDGDSLTTISHPTRRRQIEDRKEYTHYPVAGFDSFSET